MEPTEHEQDVKDILNNIMIITRLYNPFKAEYRLVEKEEEVKPGKFVTFIVDDYNYVCIRRNLQAQIIESIQQMGTTNNLSCYQINAIFRELVTTYGEPTSNHYVLEKSKLVSKPGTITKSMLNVINDICPCSKQSRLSINVSFLKTRLPFKLDNVAFLDKKDEPIHTITVYRLACIICMDRTRDMMIEPCSHLMLCFQCIGSIRDYKCPICKTEISGLRRVYT